MLICPFASADYAVKPKMNKHTKAQIFKIFNVLLDNHIYTTSQIVSIFNTVSFTNLRIQHYSNKVNTHHLYDNA